MIITGETLLQFIKENQLAPESIYDQFSLTLHLCETIKKYKFSKDHIVTYGENISDNNISIQSIDIKDGLVLQPGESILACSRESIRMPKGYMGFLQTKGSLARLFITINCCDGQIESGFHGHITFEICNLGQLAVRLLPNSPVAQLFIFEASSKIESYQGKYNNSSEPTHSNPDNKTEYVLATPTERLWQLVKYEPKGVIKIMDAEIVTKILSCSIFNKRNLLENDSSYKQIIPYAVINCDDEVYLFRRTKKQTENRLHNLYSLGVGGHMNPSKGENELSYIRAELERELNEEVFIHNNCTIESLKPLGLINDDTNEVGKVHLGVLYDIHLSNTSIEIKEKEKMEGKWIKKSDLKLYYPQMESWSKIYIDLVYEEL